MMPKSLMVLALGLVALTAGNYLTVALAIFAAFLSDYIFTKIRKVPPFLMSAAIVSGLIIGLLVHDPQIAILTSILAMAVKNFLRIGDSPALPAGRHIFNPAAAGLLAAHFIFGESVSWWGVSWQQGFIPILILLTPALISASYMKRWKIILPFLIIYGLMNKTYLDTTVIFFATVMLPEPKTSPNNTLQQIIFGSLIALASGFLNFTDPLITSLLLGNLLFFALKKLANRNTIGVTNSSN